jgi:uncharacterized phage-associated protein
MAAVSARDVAAVLRARQPGVGTKKLHKLLYYCQGHHLAAVGEPLFRDSIAAWDMGPVVDRLWTAEKRSGPASGTPPLDEAALNTIGYVLSRYGAFSGDELELMTHEESPWRRADATRRPGSGAPIRPEWIRDQFAAEVEPWPAGLPVFDVDGVESEDSLDDLRAWAARGA